MLNKVLPMRMILPPLERNYIFHKASLLPEPLLYAIPNCPIFPTYPMMAYEQPTFVNIFNPTNMLYQGHGI